MIASTIYRDDIILRTKPADGTDVQKPSKIVDADNGRSKLNHFNERNSYQTYSADDSNSSSGK